MAKRPFTSRPGRLVLPDRSPDEPDRRAAFLLSTDNRPRWIAVALRCMVAQARPKGWRLEVLVVGPPGDPAQQLCELWARQGARYLAIESPTITDRYNAGLERLSEGGAPELILLSGDDDFHCRHRLAAAAGAYLQGCPISGSSQFFRVHLGTGQIAVWDGHPWRCGALLNLSGRMLREVGGWPDVPQNRGIDWALQQRLRIAGFAEDPYDLCEVLAWDSGLGAHAPRARSTGIPWPPAGTTVQHINYRVSGAGHFSDLGEAGLQTMAAALAAEGITL